MFEFTLPSLGADMDEARLNEWMIKPGDPVAKGQVVAEVETTKSAIDVEAWHEGTVAELKVAVGETIPVGAVMATFLEPGEAARNDQPPPSTRPSVEPAESAQPQQPAPAASVVATSIQTRSPSSTPPVPSSRRRISPAARRKADSLGVDPDRVPGSGPGGAITIADVDRAASGVATIGSLPAAAHTAAERAQEMRRTIGAAMSRSKHEIPHYYLSDSIPVDAADSWLSEHNAERPVTERILLAVLLVKAVAVAAGRYPEMNGFWTDNQYHPQSGVHVGVAISLRRGGLIAPALRDVGDKSLARIQADLSDLVTRARAGKLRSSEMTDATVTVTNLGDKGVESVFGVIYPPQVALVGFGSAVVRPWVVDGEIRPAPVVVASLAADHRVSDGRRGALFLTAIRELLQHPERL